MNSLIQVYYSCPNFVKVIYEFVPPSEFKAESYVEKRRIESGCEIFKELKLIFAHMTQSKQNYYKPKAFVEAIIKDNGKPFFDGQEHDMSEAHQTVFERMKEAMKASDDEKFRNEAKTRLQEQQKGQLNSP